MIRFSRHVAFLTMVAFFLAGHSEAELRVLCLKPDGHIALERDCAVCCPIERESTGCDEESRAATEGTVAGKKPDCCRCVDLPVWMPSDPLQGVGLPRSASLNLHAFVFSPSFGYATAIFADGAFRGPTPLKRVEAPSLDPMDRLVLRC